MGVGTGAGATGVGVVRAGGRLLPATGTAGCAPY